MTTALPAPTGTRYPYSSTVSTAGSLDARSLCWVTSRVLPSSYVARTVRGTRSSSSVRTTGRPAVVREAGTTGVTVCSTLMSSSRSAPARLPPVRWSFHTWICMVTASSKPAMPFHAVTSTSCQVLEPGVTAA